MAIKPAAAFYLFNDIQKPNSIKVKSPYITDLIKIIYKQRLIVLNLVFVGIITITRNVINTVQY